VVEVNGVTPRSDAVKGTEPNRTFRLHAHRVFHSTSGRPVYSPDALVPLVPGHPPLQLRRILVVIRAGNSCEKRECVSRASRRQDRNSRYLGGHELSWSGLPVTLVPHFKLCFAPYVPLHARTYEVAQIA